MVTLSIGQCRRRRSSMLAILVAISCCLTSSFTFTYTKPQPKQLPLYSSSAYSNENEQSANSSNNSSSNSRRRAKPQRITDKNLYNILGASPNMSRTEIKRLYITLAKQTHPDAIQATDNNEDDSYVNVNNFNEIAQAWEILSDSKTRRAYDRELAANEFKDDVVLRASELAKEYGPQARKFYDDIAIPLLRRTTATTLAGWSAVTEATSEREQQRNNKAEKRERDTRANDSYKRSGVPSNYSPGMEQRTTVTDDTDESTSSTAPLEDFGRAFKRVLDATTDATNQINSLELQEKSDELRSRADGIRSESMEVYEQLQQVKGERLRLTFQTSNVDFTSADATQFLEGGLINQESTLIQRVIPFRHPVQQDIEALCAAESEFDAKLQEKYSVDEEMLARQIDLENAEARVDRAIQAEERVRRMLEDAQMKVAETQSQMLQAQHSLRGLDITVRRADQELTKADSVLKRKRDVVRRELKRKSNNIDGYNEGVQLNPGYDKSSSMNAMGFDSDEVGEDQRAAIIKSLKQEEVRIESQFLALVDKASRLVSRSERLRARSEELIGKEQQQQAAMGQVVGDTFEGISAEMIDNISEAARRNANYNSQ